MNLTVRRAVRDDLPRITEIYNQGIEDRIATLQEKPATLEEMSGWWENRSSRHAVLVIEQEATVRGWAAFNPYDHRCACAGVAELSVYVDREFRGRGLGARLLAALEETARQNGIHKIVLFALPFNSAGLRLYCKMGFRKVGVFEKHGKLDGKWVDIIAMEKVLD